MRLKLITLICIGFIVFLPTTYIHAQDTSGYYVIFGNRDASLISVNPGDTIEIPIWGATPAGGVDSIFLMHIPIASNDSVIAQRMGGYFADTMVGLWDDISFIEPEHNQPESGWTSQSMFGIDCLFDPCEPWHFFWTNGDTVLIATCRLLVSSYPALSNLVVCPFREGWHPQWGGLIWGTWNGGACIPIMTYSCLAFDTLCHYTPGDINDNGETNGIDVTYAVVYFKGGAVPPMNCYPFCQDAPNPFYAAGDVNASCSFNGLDVTYFVSYLKGGPNPLFYCPSCPPANEGFR
jgi:hypothetical protein